MIVALGSCFLPDIPDEYTDEKTLREDGLLNFEEALTSKLYFRINDKYTPHHLDFYLAEFKVIDQCL